MEMYKERKIIVVDCCDSCPFHGKCKPWKGLNRKQKMQLTLTGVGGRKFILKGCPLPSGEDNAEPLNVDVLDSMRN